MSENPLVRIPIITKAILDAQPLNYHMAQLDDLKVLRVLADKMKATIELKNDIAEAQLIIYRNAGQRFEQLFSRGGNGSNQYQEQSTRTVRLADYGINNRVADICRKIASLPDDLFDDLILSVRINEQETHQELTVSFFYKAAKINQLRQSGVNVDNKQSETGNHDRVTCPTCGGSGYVTKI